MADNIIGRNATGEALYKDDKVWLHGEEVAVVGKAGYRANAVQFMRADGSKFLFMADSVSLTNPLNKLTVVNEYGLGHIEDGWVYPEYSGQGLIYKDAGAYASKEGICYIPEHGFDGAARSDDGAYKLSECTSYGYYDVLEECDGIEQAADFVFGEVDWQHPSSFFSELDEEELAELRGEAERLNEIQEGLFITFEGADGTGKTTQVDDLRWRLEQQGREVITLREPGGTELGEAIRGILSDPRYGGMSAEAEVLLFNAARAELVAKQIKPALEAGKVVICDRFIDSTLAYQGVGRGIGPETLELVTRFATGDLLPDKTFVLDLSSELAASRIDQNGSRDRIELEGVRFQEKVAAAYREIAEAYPDRIEVIDASRSRDALGKGVFRSVQSCLASEREVPRNSKPGLQDHLDRAKELVSKKTDHESEQRATGVTKKTEVAHDR